MKGQPKARSQRSFIRPLAEMIWYLRERPPWITVAAAMLLVVAIAAGDWITGPEIAFSLFYLGPILLVTDRLGARGGLAIAVFSTSAWLLVDLLSRAQPLSWTQLWYGYWNALVRFGFFSITTVLAAAFRREQTVARRDFLTGIYNRQALLEHLDREIERARRYGRPFSFAMLDVDRFKAVNDTSGHDAGDAVLRDLAAHLRADMRQVDVVARFGGDEFAVLFAETDVAAAAAAIERLRAGVRRLAAGGDSGVTFSIGLVTFTKPAHNVDEVIKRADDALYAAKHAGGDTVTHHVVR